MKRTITKISICTVFILLLLNNLSNKIDSSILPTFNEQNKYYILEYDVYNSKEDMQQSTRDIYPKITIEKDNKFYVYIGISNNKDILNKLIDIYKKSNIKPSVIEVQVDDQEFINNAEQLEFLIKSTTNQDDILKIEEVILANYEKNFDI